MRALGRRPRTQNLIAPIAQIAQGDEYDAAKADRALAAVVETVNRMVDQRVFVADLDLIVGTNTIEHGLGRKPSMVYVTPASASSSFGWGWDPDQVGARLTMLTVIEITGVPMRARVEVR